MSPVMNQVIACATALVSVATFAEPAQACEPLNTYDWAIPESSGCVALDAPASQPGSPTIDMTNGCATPVTVSPMDCLECDSELVLAPSQTGQFTVHYSVGENESAAFGVRWTSEAGESGSFSGAVSKQEGAVDPCGDDGVCSTVRATAPVSAGWLLLLGIAVGLRRRKT